VCPVWQNYAVDASLFRCLQDLVGAICEVNFERIYTTDKASD
jgi:hypothetical protein